MTYELAEKFLKSAEELIEIDQAQERLLEDLSQAEKLLPEDVSVLCRSAKILFHYGLFNGKGRFFLLALDKLNMAEEISPLFFDKSPDVLQMWGNILIQLGKLLKETAFFEKALVKYERAANSYETHPAKLCWDLGEVWILLGQQSGEISDFHKGLSQFHLTQKKGLRSPFFRLDYACALMHYAQLIGDPEAIEQALILLRECITESYHREKEPSFVYRTSWCKYALASKLRYQLTLQKEHLEEADFVFQEAILSIPQNNDLWLEWGELYLFAGWLRRDFNFIETALEKLTSSKIKECDPLRTSFLLGIGLVIYGLFFENLKLLNEGRTRIKAALEVAPENVQLQFGASFAEFGLGLYFSDETVYAKVASSFEKGYEQDGTSLENLHALFQTYLAWGLKVKDPELVQKGMQAIARLCSLRPFCSLYLNEWGVALLRLRQLESNHTIAQGYVEEAILKFRQASTLYEDEETLYNWGCALDLLGDLTGDEEDYSKAIDLLTKAFEKRPSELHIRYHLGLAFSHLGELTHSADCFMQAIDLFDSVVKSDQEDECVWCELGYAFLNLSELIFDPNYPVEEEKMKCEAQKALTRAAELGSGDAYYHLACLYSLLGLEAKSLHFLKKAAENNSLPSKEDIEQDGWLMKIRETEAFKNFLKTFYWDKNG